MRNGWGFAIRGMTAKWEMFGKKGKTSSSVFMRKEGEIVGMDLRPFATGMYASESVEFKGTDSSSRGFEGDKYYGYRVTFYYQGVPVKVVASPTRLAEWGTAGQN